MILKYLYKTTFVTLIAFLTFSCAQEATPGGGKKDVTPPTVVESIPPNGSPGFTGNKFELKFSEFVVLDKINEQLLISPTVKEKPDFHLKGKKLIVKFKEALKPNTTYSVYFGDAIIDLTEGNPLHSFSYIFSTGDHVDSLSLSGKVLNAFDLQPAEKAMVMLYRHGNDTIPFDSLPLRVPPYYLSKTDKSGNFQFNGLANDDYMVFALKDLNSNYFYDQPSEEIAFIDSLVHPVFIAPPKVDTIIRQDTTEIELDMIATHVSDSIKVDTLEAKDKNNKPLLMFMFQQEDTKQRVMEAKLIGLNTIRFIFSIPAGDVSINAVNYPQRTLWHLSRWSNDKDTLWWYLNESALTVDTLNLLMMKNNDTVEQVFIPTKLREKTIRVARKKKNREVAKKKRNLLTFVTNMKRGIKPVSMLYLGFSQPITNIITDSVLFVAGDDSVYSPQFIPVDSLHLKYMFPVKLTEDTKYRLFLPDSCFIDWNGYFNKQKNIVFSTKALKAYGTLTVNLSPEQQDNYLFQFLNAQEEVIKQYHFTGDTTVLLSYLDPGNYLLKIINDKNNNRRWDAGNYLKKTEPESVTYYGKLVNVRANWELEETWKFNPFNHKTSPQKKKK
ncbi:MAG: hypothetical protein DRJ09_07275 [Bacteroidetes bacterium]|nr:MAG: hypothetical protein DRJ09_07275 [Bacteroidota bacterium]